MPARRALARARSRRRAVALAVAAAVFGMCSSAVEIRAETDQDRQATENAEKNGWPYARIRGISEDPVIAPLVMEQPGSADVYVGLAKFFEKAVSGGYTNGESNCAIHDQPWSSGLEGYFAARSWPQPSDKQCSSSNRPVSGDRGTSVDAEPLIDLMSRHLNVLNSIGSDVNDNLDLNFTNPNIAKPWDHEEGALKRCKVWRMSAVRYRSQWYFIQSITNDDKLRDFPEWDRMFVNELVGVDNSGKFVGLSMNLRPWPRPDKNGKQVSPGEGSSIPDPKTGLKDMNITRRPFATAFELWGGRSSASVMYDMPPADAPALRSALDDSELNADQAIDAITPSNVAILALPMVLNIIPVALVADVSSFGVFLYTIATDVLTTVPFIIKGVELVVSGTNHYRAQEIWYTGYKDSELTIAEAWACECMLKGVRRTGIIFVGIGLSFLVLGVIAEWWARRLRARWIANGTLDVPKHDHLKAHLLQRDLRMEAGLSPNKPSNPDELEEERAFLEHQSSLRDPPSLPAAVSSEPRESATVPETDN